MCVASVPSSIAAHGGNPLARFSFWQAAAALMSLFAAFRRANGEPPSRAMPLMSLSEGTSTSLTMPPLYAGSSSGRLQ